MLEEKCSRAVFAKNSVENGSNEGILMLKSVSDNSEEEIQREKVIVHGNVL